MNSRNKVIRFLKAWQDKDFKEMESYAIGAVDEPVFGDFDITGFNIRHETSLMGRNERGYYVSLSTGSDSFDVSFTVAIEPGPLQADRPSGIVISDLVESLPKEVKSTDMDAKKAIAHIESKPLKELKGFIAEDEDRVTVKRAIKTKKDES